MKTKNLLIIFLFALSPIHLWANNTWQTAVPIANNETKSGSMSGETGQGENWFKIEVPKDGTVSLTITPSSTLNINYISFKPLDKNGTPYERTYVYVGYDTKTLTVSDVAPGTYYIYIKRSGGNGSYSLKYAFAANEYANDNEPNDTFDKASSIANGQTIQGHQGYAYNNSYTDNEDWFKIEVPKDGTVSLTITPSSTLNINYISFKPLDKNGTPYERTYVYVGYDTKTLTVSDVAPGTYYIYIKRSVGYGGYTLKYTFSENRFKNDIEPNNTYKEAVSIKADETITGHLGYSYNNAFVDTEDWYKVNFSEKGVARFKIKPDTTFSISIRYIELFKTTPTGTTSKSWVYVYREEKELAVNLDEPGEYVLKVLRETGHGAYTLTFGQAVPLQGSPIRIDVIGRNAIRKGAPNPYTIKLINSSGERTAPFMLSLSVTEDIHFLGAEVPGKNGNIKLNLNNDLEGATATAQSFFVPYLDPHETYSFTVSVEGAANAKTSVKCQLAPAQTDILPAFVVGAIVSYGTGIVVDKMQDWVVEKVNEKIDLTPAEAQEYARAMNLTVEDLGMKKEKDGIGVFATKSVIKQTVEKAASLNPVTNLVFKVGNAVETAASVSQSLRRRLFYWFYTETGLIDKKTAVADGKLAADKIVASWDPNEKIGNKGYGVNNIIAKPQRMNYVILFENKKEATAPAYKVYIEDTLSELFDLSTVEFGETSHAGNNYYWKKEQDGNKLKWTIEGIELPPNVNAPEGEGYVSFSVELKPGISSGIPITNKATIVFDKNAPITTNTWTNIIDMLPPTTSMNQVGYIQGESEVTLSCTSQDNPNGSGINRYLFYVSENDAPFVAFEESNTNSIKYPISKEKEINYRFYAVATDNAGNTEQTIPQYVSFKSMTPVEQQAFNPIRVFPNPSTDGKFYLSFTDSREAIHHLSVYSSTGQLVLSTNQLEMNTNQQTLIDLSALPSGIYNASFMIGSKRAHIKLQRK